MVVFGQLRPGAFLDRNDMETIYGQFDAQKQVFTHHEWKSLFVGLGVVLIIIGAFLV